MSEQTPNTIKNTIELDFEELSTGEMKTRAIDFNTLMQKRRTVRDFSPRKVPREVIDACLTAGGSAPSGAHRQPWHFALISGPSIKRKKRNFTESVLLKTGLMRWRRLGQTRANPFSSTRLFS